MPWKRLVVFALLVACPGATAQDVRGYVQELVDQAHWGDNVTVIDGLYPENVRIAKPLSLQGAANVVIDGGAGPAIRAESHPVRLEALRLWSQVRMLEAHDMPSMDLRFIDFERGLPPRFTNVTWVRHTITSSEFHREFELVNSNYVHAHALRVRLLNASGGPRANVAAQAFDGGRLIFEGRTDALGYLPTFEVADEWTMGTAHGKNHSRLEIVGTGESYTLDPHAGIQTIGGVRAPTPFYAEPAVVVPVVGLATLGLAAAGAFQFHEGFRWRWLLWFAPLYSRFAKGELLEHDLRETIYGYVEQNPGAHLRGIKRDLGLKHGTLLHHLGMLEDHGFLKSARDGMYRRFFVMGAAPRFQGAGEMADRVLQLVKERPGTTNLALAQTLSVRPSLVHYHVQRWQEQGRIRKEKTGRETGLYVVPPGSAPPAS